jgi:DNA-binding CsgD family transcriptional regulator
MAGLLARDIRAIHRFLEGAYADAAEAPSNPNHDRGALPRPVLRGIERLIGADLVESFQLHRRPSGDAPLTTDRDEGEAPPGFDDLSALWGWNPIGAFTRQPAHGPVRLSGTMGARRLRASTWHRYYLRPLGIRDQLKVWLWSSADAAACVSLDRYASDFDDRDVAVLAVLQQHLAAMRESLMTTRPTDADRVGEPLTVREAQVLSWVARGYRNREIAEILFISPATVGKHLEHAYAKLGVRSRGEAVAALRARTASPD